MTAVTVTGLTAGYRRTPVLDRLDLDIPAGAITAVLGASGSGKTTLLRVLAGFLEPLSGEVLFGDRVVARAGDAFVPPERRRVGIVPQEGALFPHLDVAGNVGFGLPRGSDTRIDEVLELVGMAGHARCRPHELSGGQQQRVALARALAPEPDVLLLDEPFGALDAALRVRLRTEVCQLLASVGCTAVLVTHDQDEALSSADRVAVIRDGRIVQTGTPREVYATPADLGVARFVGSAVELAATADPGRSRVSCALGEVPVRQDSANPVAGEAVVMLRPEQLTLRAGDAAGPGRGAGVVSAAEYHGHDSLLWVQLSGGDRIPVRVPGGTPVPAVGERVVVTVTGEGLIYPPESGPPRGGVL